VRLVPPKSRDTLETAPPCPGESVGGLGHESAWCARGVLCECARAAGNGPVRAWLCARRAAGAVEEVGPIHADRCALARPYEGPGCDLGHALGAGGVPHRSRGALRAVEAGGAEGGIARGADVGRGKVCACVAREAFSAVVVARAVGAGEVAIVGPDEGSRGWAIGAVFTCRS
jgi:hypothetical protein